MKIQLSQCTPLFHQSASSPHTQLKKIDNYENDYLFLEEEEGENGDDEHIYHVLEEHQVDDYEELDKYEVKRQSEGHKNIQYTLEGPMIEGEGPKGGASTSDILTSEGCDMSELIQTNGH